MTTYTLGAKPTIYVLHLTRNELATMRRAVVHYEQMLDAKDQDDTAGRSQDWWDCGALLALNATEETA